MSAKSANETVTYQVKMIISSNPIDKNKAGLSLLGKVTGLNTHHQGKHWVDQPSFVLPLIDKVVGNDIVQGW